jgi:hypothetical protein
VDSGRFGCYRRNGQRFHEGIDIQCRQRDSRGEPIDPVHAVADGEVAFINSKPGLSNYGRYVVLAHRWSGVEVFTLYAHLSAVSQGLVVGQPVTRGQVIATMGHTSNTREGIPPERAHLHFEIDVMLNPQFRIWYAQRDPKAPPFGNFNGKSLFGIDPAAFIKAYAANRQLNFAEYCAHQPIGFTVLVRTRPFPWLQMHPEQLQTGGQAIAYEVGVTAFGVPVAVWPRTAKDVNPAQLRIAQGGGAVLCRVNEAELERYSCRGLVSRSRKGWRLTDEGREWVELLTYGP